MNVATILKQKGRAVTTASPAATLLEVAEKLSAKRIGAIVIVGAGGEVSGILSEHDIIRRLEEKRAQADLARAKRREEGLRRLQVASAEVLVPLLLCGFPVFIVMVFFPLGILLLRNLESIGGALR